ncbi:MAG: superoxide dismutase [Candidatus Dependentiae bacterium]|nr:superoxide dismutase [Candidatus Dependentiae bacterium]
MMFTVPRLSYSYDALLPYIDAQTMEIHITKHHQAYVDNLNKALSPYPELQKLSLEDLLTGIEALPGAIKTAVRNNAGGHYNHTLFWEMMKPSADMKQGLLIAEIQKKFGTYQAFKDQFETAAKTRFGSGWAWLVLNKAGDLEVFSTPNQDAPLMQGAVPLLGLDVWEHAYYLHYQNRRPDYITAWWNVVNWEFVEERYRSVIGK